MNMNRKKYLMINILVSFMLTGALFIWTGEVSYLRTIDVLFGVGVILIGFAWLLFISNYGLMDIAIYGTKRFWLVLLGKGKKIESNFFEYTTNREKLDKYTYWYMGIVGSVYFTVSMILYFLEY